MGKNLTRKEKDRFKVVNAIHPTKWTSNEEHDFYYLLGRQYLGKATRKNYTESQKKFYRDQGNFAIKKADRIKKKYIAF